MSLSARLAALACFSMLLTQQAVAGPPFPLKARLKFDEKSPYALVLFEAKPQKYFAYWNIEVFSFAPETRTWTYGPLKGWARFGDIGERPAEDSFFAALVKPAGTYAVNNISTQGLWHACFNGGTRAFTVEAGKVSYIGAIDPGPALEQVANELPETSTNYVHYVVYDTPRLALTPPSQRPDWNAAVTAFMAKRFPNVTAPIVAVEPTETTFTPGHSIVAGKLCQKY